MPHALDQIGQEVSACRLCAERFSATRTAHAPRPVFWLSPTPRILVAGQAPGLQVHRKGRPFDDRSGDRLRDWMGIDRATFYDRTRISVLPMAFCFPGYDAKGADLPPPPVCARTWHHRVMEALGPVPLILAIGRPAQRFHAGAGRRSVTDTVAGWQAHAPGLFPLPHPSWRNTGWLKRNPWFEAELLPVLRTRVAEVLRA